MARSAQETSALPPLGARKRLWALRAAAGVLVTLGLMALLLALADWRAILAAADDLGGAVLAEVTALMALTQLARAVRLGLILRVPVARRFANLLRVTVLHNFFSMYAPMRLGDFTLIWLVKRHFGFALSTSVGLFLCVRLLDLLFLLASAGIAAWFVIPADSAVAWLRYLAPAVLIGVALLLLLAWTWGAGGGLKRIDQRWRASQGRILPALAGIVGILASMEPARLLRIVAATAAAWACIFAASYAAAAAVLPAAGLAIAVWAADGGGLSFALPVTGVANLGTYEATTVAALSLARIPIEEALLLAVLLHGAILLAPLVLLPTTLLAGGRSGTERPAG